MFATTLATLGHVYSGYKQIRPHLDAQLVVMAYTIKTFITEDLDREQTLGKLQANSEQYEKSIRNLSYDDIRASKDLHASLDNVQFRVFNKKQQLVAHSPSAPKVAANTFKHNGFFKLHVHNTNWRVFNLTTPHGERIIVMQPHNIRLDIEKNNNNTAVLITLLTIPPLGIFIFLIIGRSLQSLTRTSNEIRQRQHNNLDPITTQDIPIEIMPLIGELNSLFDRLEQTFMRESRFAGDAAHELKTPLAALRTHAQVARGCKNLADMQHELQKVDDAVMRATRTVNQLLVLSRTMPDAYMNAHSPLALAQEIRQCIAELIPSAHEKNINISFDETKSTTNARIQGHALTLRLLFSNLISNAIQYSYPNTEILVQLKEDTQHHIVHVIDQGPGIPENLRDRVFERFYRAPGSQAQGTGLGLNIAKQVATLHHAYISIHTGPDEQGTCCKVTIPKSTCK